MSSLLKVARERARAAVERRIMLSVPGREGVDVVCKTLTGDVVARTDRSARKRFPDDGVLAGLAQAAAVLAESVVQIIVDGEIVETDDGDAVTLKTKDAWADLADDSGRVPSTASEAARFFVGRDGDLKALADAIVRESGFRTDGSSLVAGENPI